MKTKSTKIKIAAVYAAFAFIFALNAETADSNKIENGKIEAILTDTCDKKDFEGMSYTEKKELLEKAVLASRKMPGPIEDRTAKVLTAAISFTRSCDSGDTCGAISDVITVLPYEALPPVVEEFSKGFLYRNANGAEISNSDFTHLSTKIVSETSKDSNNSEDRIARRTFAVIMLLKADDGGTTGLKDSLVSLVDSDEEVRKTISNKWIPSAMSEDKSFDGILEYADSGKAPNLDIVLSLTGPQILDSLLVDMVGGLNNENGIQTTSFVDQSFGGFDEAGIYMQTMRDSTSETGFGEVPKSNANVPWNPKYNRDSIECEVSKEPEPYPFTTM